jgi:G3E family GTPase
VNEFGDINIGSQLLISVDEDMVELTNGCICCTINDNLVDAVYRVLEREDRIDYLVIETTGVADPLPILLTFLGTELRDFTNLDSILTVVDSEAFDEEHFCSEDALRSGLYVFTYYTHHLFRGYRFCEQICRAYHFSSNSV